MEQEKENQKQYHVHLKMQICRDQPVLGPGVAELLELVQKTGSMKEACGSMGMSYSKGWKIINRAEQELGYPLLYRCHGGKSGGSCKVTDESIQIINLYRKLEKEVQIYADKKFSELFSSCKNFKTGRNIF